MTSWNVCRTLERLERLEHHTSYKKESLNSSGLFFHNGKNTHCRYCPDRVSGRVGPRKQPYSSAVDGTIIKGRARNHFKLQVAEESDDKQRGHLLLQKSCTNPTVAAGHILPPDKRADSAESQTVCGHGFYAWGAVCTRFRGVLSQDYT